MPAADAPRVRIKARDLAHLEEVRREVASEVPIYVESRQRLTLSTGPLPDAVQERLEELGATVRPELRYDLDQ